MIPLTIADEIRATLLDYLTTTFNFQDPAVEEALLDFLIGSQGMFRGPYVHLRLPFRKALPEERPLLEIVPAFRPYVHQLRAFERLTSRYDRAPQPTIITTGTGSGKTECFLYPILDHCHAHAGEPGIKAILLYPMNALASDQAARLAGILWDDERLRGQVTAGIYVGGEGEQTRATLGPDHLIDDRNALRQNPPDILLTNYKMLDFLLLRPDDRSLWIRNRPETLRYLVLDELHTYDGAQGSDVACLIRRLKARLATPEGVLCPVGTSATVVGEAGDTAADLTRFAQEIFGVPFPPEAVIGEQRVSLAEFLPEPATRFDLPMVRPSSPQADIEALQGQPGEAHADYIGRQMRLWFGAELDPLDSAQDKPLNLGDSLCTHSFLRTLLTVMGDDIVAVDKLIEQLARWEPDFDARPPGAQRALLQSFLALIAHARARPEGAGEPVPLLTLQVQSWVREMSRLVHEVSAVPRFFWRDDVPYVPTGSQPPGADEQRRGLPAYYCRECGHTGWLAVRREGDKRLTDDPATIYHHYFERHKNTTYVYPAPPDGEGERLVGDYVCPRCLGLGFHARCHDCGVETIPVHVHAQSSKPKGARPLRDLQRCPICDTDNALSIAGSGAASLSSVAISHLYTSPLNADKKLLAFTDSVQDASHRAAFFGARTYRFNLRTAFQSLLENAADDSIPLDESIPMDTFTDRLLDHWLQAWQDLPATNQKLVAAFMPPDLRDLPAYRRFITGLAKPIPPDLRHALHRRLSWEVTMEYGFNARVGRSLEKVGSSTGFLDPARLDAAMEKLALILPEEIGLLRDVAVGDVRHFVVGLLERTRTRGGVAHPLLKPYAEDQGNWFLLTKKIQPLLSPFSKHSPRFPRFLTDTFTRDVFDLYITSGARHTWYVDWAQKALSPALGLQDINEIYRLVIPRLADAGLLVSYQKGNAHAYGLEPAALRVTRHTARVRCDRCGQRQTLALGTRDDWLDRACLNYRCPGRYQPDTRVEQQYYRAVYERGQVERIFTAEHTGLLDRETREAVETQFKQQTQADAPNLLAATPTLEMGIDIGDLSATMACAVPPSTANYLQRIGRAGRKTGNSLVLALANVQPHDLYFFTQPLEMIAGAIVPPGCFLDAPNMLRRQFLAFCMDTWTATDPQAKQLPRTVRDMLSSVKRGGFPEGLLTFYERHKATLIERFLEMFGAVVSPENQSLLRALANGDDVPNSVRAAVTAVADERTALRADYRALRRQQDKIRADPSQYEDPDAEIADIERERKLILATIKQMEDKYILNFFTDAGLLPNYAFPETGVRLRAIITGLDVDEEDDAPKRYAVQEYVRPAPVAISELAPFNTFYAQGRRVRVSHVNVERGDVLERWQFCPRCSYMAPVSTSHYHPACPACGSPMWNDLGQQHDMLRFRQASAWADHWQSLTGDENDVRDREAYQTGRYFQIPEQEIGHGLTRINADGDEEEKISVNQRVSAVHSPSAYIIPALPFGIEYLRQVTLREINFGLSETWGKKVFIAGEEQPEKGYQVCPSCGAVKDFREDAEPRHTRNCTARSGNRAVEWHDLYLYREITSEALRVLLPVSTVLIGEKLTTFNACLDLGLRLKFQGNPGHLQILPHTEVAPDGTQRRYLMIYDAVPGGTSFLRDLAKPDEFQHMLQMVLNRLTSCPCRLDPNRPACYRCLYSYRAQGSLEFISRKLGVEMLQEVLAHWSDLGPIASLSDADMVSLVESELEQRFVDALGRYAQDHADCTWRARLHNGRQAWDLSIGETRWMVEPQVLLGPKQGVAVPSRPDFIFWPQGETAKAARPVAVFADGFAYHVQGRSLGSDRDRLADDVRKRRAIVESGKPFDHKQSGAQGKFLVWSVVWDDVIEFQDDEPFGLPPFFDGAQQRLVQRMFKQVSSAPLPSLVWKNGVRQLLTYLQDPDQETWSEFAKALAVAVLTPPRPPVNGALLDQKTAALREDAALPPLDVPDDAAPGEHLYGVIERGDNHLLMHAPQAAVKTKDAAQMTLTLRLDDTVENRAADGFKHDWRQFLLLTNLYQFLPGFVPVTTTYAQQFAPSEPEPEVVAEAEAAPEIAIPDEWAEAFEYAPDCRELVLACVTAAAPPPVVGYELADDAGGVAGAMAELAWEAHQIAVFLPEQEDDRAAFVQAGWRAFDPNQIEAILEALNSPQRRRER